MESTGDLAEGVLPKVLRDLYVGRRTGLLHVTRGEERGSVCFIQGNIVFGESTIKECHLGETLVRHGLLSEWEFERATDMVTVTGKRLGEVLVDLGNLDAEGLEDALALHVREVLLTIFSWREGSYSFDEKAAEVFRGYDHPLRLSTGEVILDAVWSISDPDAIRFALGDLGRVPVPASDPLLRFQRLSLTPTDGFILSRVDGVITAQEILAMAPVGPEEAQRSLFGLLYTGMVEFLPKVAAPAPAASRAVRTRVLEAYCPPGDRNSLRGPRRRAQGERQRDPRGLLSGRQVLPPGLPPRAGAGRPEGQARGALRPGDRGPPGPRQPSSPRGLRAVPRCGGSAFGREGSPGSGRQSRRPSPGKHTRTRRR